MMKDRVSKFEMTLMKQPERVIEPTVDWCKYQLLNDMPSKSWFVGTDCKLCKPGIHYKSPLQGDQASESKARTPASCP